MKAGKRGAGEYRTCAARLTVVLLTGLISFVGCSKDPVTPGIQGERVYVQYISYFDRANLDLMCAIKTGDSWAIKIVDSERNVGWFTSLALDPQGNPHIVYHDDRNNLKYAVLVDDEWEPSTVDSENVVYERSIAIDAQGNPHIVYCANSCAGEPYTCVKYAVKSGDAWELQLIESNCGGNHNLLPSIAVDAQGNPHVVYYYQRTTDLRYAVKDGDDWQIEFIEETGENVGSNCALALDAQGNPHVSYWNVNQNRVSYASKSGDDWVPEVLSDAGGSGGLHGHRTSIAVDVHGNPHIAYHFWPEDLGYAVKTDGDWSFEIVDSEGKVGAYPSLAFDSQANPCIAYLDYTGNYRLKFAVRSGGEWVPEDVDPWGSRGEWCSMAIGSR